MPSPTLPAWIPLRRTDGGMGRASASVINRAAPTQKTRTQTVTAEGAAIPIAYGTSVQVPGKIFAFIETGGNLYFGVLWCIGEVSAINAVYLNNATMPVGVTVTNYVGTPTQGVDATLAAAVPAYADTMRIPVPDGYVGICYSVIVIPDTETIDASFQFRADIDGLLVYDERVDLTQHSDNSALFLAHMISNTNYGLGVPVTGAGDCADWCDTLLGETDEKRARLSLLLTDPMPVPNLLPVLAEYAECWYTPNGEGYTITPDSTVGLETVPTVAAADIINGTLRLSAEDDSDSPTEIDVRYSEPSGGATPWATESVISRIPGVDTGDIRRIPTSIQLPHVYRAEEAVNKGMSRLLRLQNRIKATWQTFDDGVIYQTGDVVQIEHVARGISMPVRILAVDLAAPGRYAVTAQRYDHSHYPSEIVLPDNIGVVPVGAITLMSGDTVPDGWEAYSSADGKFIIGAGGALDPTNFGGDSLSVSFSGNTSSDGAHGSGAGDLPILLNYNLGGFTMTTAGGAASDHSHTVSTSATDISIYRRENRLVRKITAEGTTVPQDLMILGLASLQNPDIQRIYTSANRLIQAAAANADAGSETQALATTTGAAGGHTHVSSLCCYTAQSDFGPCNSPRYNGAVPDHTHSCTLTVAANPKRVNLALYGGLKDYKVVPGTIFMWAGSVASLPTDYVLCDGTNGTPDMRDHFVKISQLGNELVVEGDNTVSATGTVADNSHAHQGGVSAEGCWLLVYTYHAATVTHNHIINISQALTPPYFALAFIMYAPAGA